MTATKWSRGRGEPDNDAIASPSLVEMIRREPRTKGDAGEVLGSTFNPYFVTKWFLSGAERATLYFTVAASVGFAGEAHARIL